MCFAPKIINQNSLPDLHIYPLRGSPEFTEEKMAQNMEGGYRVSTSYIADSYVLRINYRNENKIYFRV